MNFKKTLLASLLMISASGAFAAETATLSVKGTIAPSACNVTLGGASQGELTFDSTEYTGARLVLEPQTIPFNIACSPNALAVTYAVSDDASSTPITADAFGLGQHNNGAEIGFFIMNLSDATANNLPAKMISRHTGGAWVEANAVIKSSYGTNSFALGTGEGPTRANDFSATLVVSPTINADLPFDDAIELAGAATVTVSMM